jgi:uroporphyrinogen-III synthase
LKDKIKILLTREEKNNYELQSELQSREFTVTSLPLIKIVPLTTPEVINTVKDLTIYDYILITSLNSAELFLPLIKNNGFVPGILAIFNKSADAVRRAGFEPVFTGDGRGGAAFAKQINKKINFKGRVFLHPCSSLTGSGLIDEAYRLGAEKVTRLPVYENVMPLDVDSTKLFDHDIICFYSGSAVKNFLTAVADTGFDFDGQQVVSAGASTTAVLKDAGFKNIAEAESPAVKDMADAVQAALF